MTTVHLTRLAPLALGLGLLAGLPGCDAGAAQKADVSGTIKLRGQPPKFTGLQIAFTGAGGATAVAHIAEDGTYKAENVPTGDVTVYFLYVTPEAVMEGERIKAGGGRMAKPDQKGQSTARIPKGPPISPVPTDLREARTSRLTCKVEAGKTTTFDYDIPVP